MRTEPYPSPLDGILSLDEPDLKEWLDYAALGVRPAHVPDLIRMALDDDLYAQGEEEPEGWAYVHAWRALAQMGAVEAVPALLTLFERREDDEAVLDELPRALGRIGLKTLPALTAYLADPAHEAAARALAAEAVAAVGSHFPEAREESIRVLAGQLAQFAEQPRELNSFLVGDLVKLKAGEHAPLVQRAYEARAVSVGIAGPWDMVRRDLGVAPSLAPIEMEEAPAKPVAPARGQAAPARPASNQPAPAPGAPGIPLAAVVAESPAGAPPASGRAVTPTRGSDYPAPKGGKGKRKHGGKKRR